MNKPKSSLEFNNIHYQNESSYQNNDLRLQIMAKLIDKKHRILDLGCGTGNLLKLIKNRNKEGLEISKKAAKIGQKNGFKIKIADACQSLPYKENTFNTVVVGEIIEHIYDTDFFLKEIKKILKPNGHLIISTPNLATLGRRLMLFFGFNPLIETSLENSAGHIRYFTKKSLEQLLQKHYFKTIRFQSDTVNFTNNGKLQSQLLAKFFPKLGARIIIKAVNKK